MINYKIFSKTIKFFIKACSKIGFTYSDLLISLNLKNNDYPDDILKKVQDYIDCSESQKEMLKDIESPENIALIEKIISLSSLPVKLIDVISNQNNKEIFDILLLSSELNLSEIKELSDENLIINLIDILKEAVKALEQASEYKAQFEKPEDTFLFIEYYNNRKKSPDDIDELVNNQIEYKPWNIFDLSWFQNNIITGLRKDKYSIEWLESSDLHEVFLDYLDLCDRNLIQSADYWFREKLREIETKLNAKDVETGDEKEKYRERTPEEKLALAKKLDKEYFIENKKE